MKLFVLTWESSASVKGSSARILVHTEKFNRRFVHKSQPLAAVGTESFRECSCAALRTVPTPPPRLAGNCAPGSALGA
jgi:hypothetical protein